MTLRRVGKRLSKHLADVIRYGHGMTPTNGNALVARLARSAFDLDIPKSHAWSSGPQLTPCWTLIY
ncbi:hypothetical protein [Bradyrhizobium sp.]|uniref:hypothetical protein n=1 Tax=Bradyrhizobium sp. TaxID=376 RepID=UPI001EB6E9B2|nr:hypothetical protein [Bradyrhizobium sp.]MBV9979568.1 hypothetical protein [Bradyrhizobium sp.]